jgi:hypothetical protein
MLRGAADFDLGHGIAVLLRTMLYQLVGGGAIDWPISFGIAAAISPAAFGDS